MLKPATIRGCDARFMAQNDKSYVKYVGEREFTAGLWASN
jgi:hypothetical protein